MSEATTWPFEALSSRAADLPRRMLTRSSFVAGGALDPISALLLPAGGGMEAEAWRDVGGPEDCVGLWLGTPFPPRAPRAGWACNFPPSSWLGEPFAKELEEMGLGPAREASNLTTLRAAACRTLLAVAADSEAGEADGLLVIVSESGPGGIERPGGAAPCALLDVSGRVGAAEAARWGFDALVGAPQPIP